MSTQNYLQVTNRSEIEIKGVKDIISYDCNKIVFMLEESELTVCGSDFNVKKLDIENKLATVNGRVDSLVYSCDGYKRGRSILTSLFK